MAKPSKQPPPAEYDPFKTPLGQAYDTADRLYAEKMTDTHRRAAAANKRGLSVDQATIDEANRPQRETYYQAKDAYDRHLLAIKSGFSQHLGTLQPGDRASMKAANKKAGVAPPSIAEEKLKGKQMPRAVTDPISGRKLQKGRPVDNAPGPDNFDIAADTVKRTGAAIGTGAKKALSWTPDVKAPPKKSPLGQLGSSLDDLSDTMQGKKKLSEQKLKGSPAMNSRKERKNVVWGDDSAKQKLKGPMKPKAALKAPSARKAMKTKHPMSSQGPVFPPKKKSAAPPSAPFSPAGRQPVPPLPTVGPGISYQGLAGRLPQAAAGPAQRLSGASGMGPAQRLGPTASAGPAERMSISGPVRGGRSATPRPTTPRPTGLQRPTGMSFEKLSGNCKGKAMGHGRKK